MSPLANRMSFEVEWAMTAESALKPPDDFVRARPRRRPSGEPPPLPKHINKSGKWWLAVAVVLSVLAVFGSLFAEGYVHVEVIDHAVLEWFAAVRTPWLTDLATVVAAPATAV